MRSVYGNSIKQSLVTTVAFVTGLVLSLSFAFTIYIQNLSHKESLIQRTETMLQILSSSLLEPVQNADLATAENILNGLKNSDFITHVHLYRPGPLDAQATYFTSYNRPHTAPLPIRTSQLAELTTPRVNTDNIELVTTLYNNDRSAAGYIYIRTSLQELQDYMWRSIAIFIGTLIAGILLAIITARLMHSRVLQPIRLVNERVREIHLQKNYALRLPPAELIEISQFSIGVNGILDKLQRVIQYSDESEAQQRELTAELELKIQQRTQALRTANNELIEALEQLHAGQQRRIETERLASMTDMVAGIAHEINTPLGLSVTAASILEERLASLSADCATRNAESCEHVFNELKSNIAIVQRNLARAGELIGNFRSLAFEHANESPEALNLKVLTDNTADQVRPLLERSSNYALKVDAPDQMITLRRRPLETILAELLENAILHGFKGQKRGTIELKVDSNDELLLISCRDDGVGMTDEMQHRVFEPFMTSNRVSGHPGLGMHLVYNLVRHILKGTIVCESALGEGTLVKVEIPLTE